MTKNKIKTCEDYVRQYIRCENVDTHNTVRYGRHGFFMFKAEWDKNIPYWGPLILKVMQKQLRAEWRIYGNNSVTSSRRLIGD